MHDNIEKCSVAVIGNGPAGSAISIALAKSGTSVTILGQKNKSDWKIGETLPPLSRPILAQLGLLDQLNKDNHLTSAGNFSVWGEEEAVESHFIFSPYGSGWHLDRVQFDQMLLDTASRAGTHVLDSKVFGAKKVKEKWILSCVTDRYQPIIIMADFVVDATGRSSWFALKRGVRRDFYDRLIGFVGLFSCQGNEDTDSLSLVEATQSGWWYSVILAGKRRVVAFFTDWALPEAKIARTVNGWLSLLEQTTILRKRLYDHSYKLIRGPRVMLANSSRLIAVTGKDWLAVGDAAAAHDPLSSQGIISALNSAKEASTVIKIFLDGDSSMLKSYSDKINSDYNDYLRQRRFYYGRVRRWPNSEFWLMQSRKVPAADLSLDL